MRRVARGLLQTTWSFGDARVPSMVSFRCSYTNNNNNRNNGNARRKKDQKKRREYNNNNNNISREYRENNGAKSHLNDIHKSNGNQSVPETPKTTPSSSTHLQSSSSGSLSTTLLAFCRQWRFSTLAIPDGYSEIILNEIDTLRKSLKDEATTQQRKEGQLMVANLHAFVMFDLEETLLKESLDWIMGNVRRLSNEDTLMIYHDLLCIANIKDPTLHNLVLATRSTVERKAEGIFHSVSCLSRLTVLYRAFAEGHLPHRSWQLLCLDDIREGRILIETSKEKDTTKSLCIVFMVAYISGSINEIDVKHVRQLYDTCFQRLPKGDHTDAPLQISFNLDHDAVKISKSLRTPYLDFLRKHFLTKELVIHAKYNDFNLLQYILKWKRLDPSVKRCVEEGLGDCEDIDDLPTLVLCATFLGSEHPTFEKAIHLLTNEARAAKSQGGKSEASDRGTDSDETIDAVEVINLFGPRCSLQRQSVILQDFGYSASVKVLKHKQSIRALSFVGTLFYLIANGAVSCGDFNAPATFLKVLNEVSNSLTNSMDTLYTSDVSTILMLTAWIQTIFNRMFDVRSEKETNVFSVNERDHIQLTIQRLAEASIPSFARKAQPTLLSSRRVCILRVPLSSALRNKAISLFTTMASGINSSACLFKEALPLVLSDNEMSSSPILSRLVGILQRLEIADEYAATLFFGHPNEAVILIKNIQQLLQRYSELYSDNQSQLALFSRFLKVFFGPYARGVTRRVETTPDKSSSSVSRLSPEISEAFTDLVPGLVEDFSHPTWSNIQHWHVEEVLTAALQCGCLIPQEASSLITSATNSVFAGESKAILNEFPTTHTPRLTSHFVAAMKMYLVTYVDLSPRNISHILDSIQPGGIPLILLSIHQANGDVSKVLERVMTCSPAICALTLRVWGSAPKRAGFNTFETPNIAVLLTEVAERVDREHAIQLIKMSSSLLTLPNSVVAVLWRKTEGAFLELHVSKDGEGDVIKPNISIQNESLLIVGAKDASQSEEICASLMQRNANLLVLLSNLQMKVPMIFIDAALQQMAEKVEDKSVSSFGPQVGMVKYVAAQVFGEDVLKLNVKQAPTRDKKGGVVAVSEFRICYEYLQRLKTLFDLLKTSEGSASDIERLLLITGGICTALQHHKANLDSKACTERSHEIDDVVANTLLSISGLIEVFVKLDATTPEQLEKTLSGVPSVLKPLMMSIKLEKMVSDELKSISLADAPCIDASKIFEFQHVLEKNGVYSQLLQDTMFDVLMFPSASQSNTNAEETINSALIANGTKLLRNSLRGSSSEKTIDIVTRRLIALSPEGGRVDHQMKILQCFSEAPTVAKQHEIVVEELIGSGGTGLNAADFAKIVATMSRMKSLSNHRDGVKRVLERFFSTADPHSQTIILKGLSHDKEIILDNLDLLFDSIEGNIEVLGGDDLENVATALIQVSPFVAFEDVEDIIERVSTRVLSVADAAKKSSLVRVLQLLTHYKLQDTAVLEAIYESLEDKMPKLDINQLITVLKSMVVLEMQPRDKLILQVIRKLDSFIETMSPALIVSTLSLMVDLNIAFLPTTNSLFMKAHDHKDAIRQNKELTSLMEKASSEFIIEAPQHVTRHFLKRQKERLRMEALRQNILERRAKSLTVVV